MLDKKLWPSIHPRLPRFLGLKQDFINAASCGSAHELQRLLHACAAAPPIMPSVFLDGGWALDGGYTDNAPIPQQSVAEKNATLVLLTRHYPRLPQLFRWRDRCYWQPSRRVPVSTWDCTRKTSVAAAFELGVEDAKQVLAGGVLSDA